MFSFKHKKYHSSVPVVTEDTTASIEPQEGEGIVEEEDSYQQGWNAGTTYEGTTYDTDPVEYPPLAGQPYPTYGPSTTEKYYAANISEEGAQGEGRGIVGAHTEGYPTPTYDAMQQQQQLHPTSSATGTPPDTREVSGVHPSASSTTSPEESVASPPAPEEEVLPTTPKELLEWCRTQIINHNVLPPKQWRQIRFDLPHDIAGLRLNPPLPEPVPPAALTAATTDPSATVAIAQQQVPSSCIVLLLEALKPEGKPVAAYVHEMLLYLLQCLEYLQSQTAMTNVRVVKKGPETLFQLVITLGTDVEMATAFLAALHEVGIPAVYGAPRPRSLAAISPMATFHVVDYRGDMHEGDPLPESSQRRGRLGKMKGVKSTAEGSVAMSEEKGTGDEQGNQKESKEADAVSHSTAATVAKTGVWNRYRYCGITASDLHLLFSPYRPSHTLDVEVVPGMEDGVFYVPVKRPETVLSFLWNPHCSLKIQRVLMERFGVLVSAADCPHDFLLKGVPYHIQQKQRQEAAPRRAEDGLSGSMRGQKKARGSLAEADDNQDGMASFEMEEEEVDNDAWMGDEEQQEEEEEEGGPRGFGAADRQSGRTGMAAMLGTQKGGEEPREGYLMEKTRSHPTERGAGVVPPPEKESSVNIFSAVATLVSSASGWKRRTGAEDDDDETMAREEENEAGEPYGKATTSDTKPSLDHPASFTRYPMGFPSYPSSTPPPPPALARTALRRLLAEDDDDDDGEEEEQEGVLHEPSRGPPPTPYAPPPYTARDRPWGVEVSSRFPPPPQPYGAPCPAPPYPYGPPRMAAPWDPAGTNVSSLAPWMPPPPSPSSRGGGAGMTYDASYPPRMGGPVASYTAGMSSHLYSPPPLSETWRAPPGTAIPPPPPPPPVLPLTATSYKPPIDPGPGETQTPSLEERFSSSSPSYGAALVRGAAGRAMYGGEGVLGAPEEGQDWSGRGASGSEGEGLRWEQERGSIWMASSSASSAPTTGSPPPPFITADEAEAVVARVEVFFPSSWRNNNTPIPSASSARPCIKTDEKEEEELPSPKGGGTSQQHDVPHTGEHDLHPSTTAATSILSSLRSGPVKSSQEVSPKRPPLPPTWGGVHLGKEHAIPMESLFFTLLSEVSSSPLREKREEEEEAHENPTSSTGIDDEAMIQMAKDWKRFLHLCGAEATRVLQAVLRGHYTEDDEDEEDDEEDEDEEESAGRTTVKQEQDNDAPHQKQDQKQERKRQKSIQAKRRFMQARRKLLALLFPTPSSSSASLFLYLCFCPPEAVETFVRLPFTSKRSIAPSLPTTTSSDAVLLVKKEKSEEQEDAEDGKVKRKALLGLVKELHTLLYTSGLSTLVVEWGKSLQFPRTPPSSTATSGAATTTVLLEDREFFSPAAHAEECERFSLLWWRYGLYFLWRCPTQAVLLQLAQQALEHYRHPLGIEPDGSTTSHGSTDPSCPTTTTTLGTVSPLVSSLVDQWPSLLSWMEEELLWRALQHATATPSILSSGGDARWGSSITTTTTSPPPPPPLPRYFSVEEVQHLWQHTAVQVRTAVEQLLALCSKPEGQAAQVIFHTSSPASLVEKVGLLWAAPSSSWWGGSKSEDEENEAKVGSNEHRGETIPLLLGGGPPPSGGGIEPVRKPQLFAMLDTAPPSMNGPPQAGGGGGWRRREMAIALTRAYLSSNILPGIPFLLAVLQCPAFAVPAPGTTTTSSPHHQHHPSTASFTSRFSPSHYQFLCSLLSPSPSSSSWSSHAPMSMAVQGKRANEGDRGCATWPLSVAFSEELAALAGGCLRAMELQLQVIRLPATSSTAEGGGEPDGIGGADAPYMRSTGRGRDASIPRPPAPMSIPLLTEWDVYAFAVAALRYLLSHPMASLSEREPREENTPQPFPREDSAVSTREDVFLAMQHAYLDDTLAQQLGEVLGFLTSSSSAATKESTQGAGRRTGRLPLDPSSPMWTVSLLSHLPSLHRVLSAKTPPHLHQVETLLDVGSTTTSSTAAVMVSGGDNSTPRGTGGRASTFASSSSSTTTTSLPWWDPVWTEKMSTYPKVGYPFPDPNGPSSSSTPPLSSSTSTSTREGKDTSSTNETVEKEAAPPAASASAAASCTYRVVLSRHNGCYYFKPSTKEPIHRSPTYYHPFTGKQYLATPQAFMRDPTVSTTLRELVEYVYTHYVCPSLTSMKKGTSDSTTTNGDEESTKTPSRATLQKEAEAWFSDQRVRHPLLDAAVLLKLKITYKEPSVHQTSSSAAVLPPPPPTSSSSWAPHPPYPSPTHSMDATSSHPSSYPISDGTAAGFSHPTSMWTTTRHGGGGAPPPPPPPPWGRTPHPHSLPLMSPYPPSSSSTAVFPEGPGSGGGLGMGRGSTPMGGPPRWNTGLLEGGGGGPDGHQVGMAEERLQWLLRVTRAYPSGTRTPEEPCSSSSSSFFPDPFPPLPRGWTASLSTVYGLYVFRCRSYTGGTPVVSSNSTPAGGGFFTHPHTRLVYRVTPQALAVSRGVRKESFQVFLASASEHDGVPLRSSQGTPHDLHAISARPPTTTTAPSGDLWPPIPSREVTKALLETWWNDQRERHPVLDMAVVQWCKVDYEYGESQRTRHRFGLFGEAPQERTDMGMHPTRGTHHSHHEIEAHDGDGEGDSHDDDDDEEIQEEGEGGDKKQTTSQRVDPSGEGEKSGETGSTTATSSERWRSRSSRKGAREDAAHNDDDDEYEDNDDRHTRRRRRSGSSSRRGGRPRMEEDRYRRDPLGSSSSRHRRSTYRREDEEAYNDDGDDDDDDGPCYGRYSSHRPPSSNRSHHRRPYGTSSSERGPGSSDPSSSGPRWGRGRGGSGNYGGEHGGRFNDGEGSSSFTRSYASRNGDHRRRPYYR